MGRGSARKTETWVSSLSVYAIPEKSQEGFFDECWNHRITHGHVFAFCPEKDVRHFQKAFYYTTDIFCRFLSIGEEKMSPLSKKRGHHDLRILRFERTASTAGVRTHGDFGSIPSPLHLAYSPMFRRYPIMNHSVPGACFLHELQIKTVQHSTDGNAEQHP